jgi:hypothetical protein
VGGIFISYRQSDAKGFAGALMRELKGRFGAVPVFMDVEGIEGGIDFPAARAAAVDTCAVLLVLIDRGWLEARDDAGSRCLADPGDFVRQEIRRALGRGARVIPVLLEGAPPPWSDALPDDLAPLEACNVLHLTNAHWEYQVDHLIDHIRSGLFEHAGAEAPADLAPLPPKRRGLRRFLMVGYAVASLIAAAGEAYREDRRIASAGHAWGTVVEVRSGTRKSPDGTESSGFYPVVEFRTESDGIVRIASQLVTTPPTYAVGDKVPVMYERTAPQSGHIDGFGDRWRKTLVYALLGVVLLIVGPLWRLGVGWNRRRRFKALLRDGHPVITEIHSVESKQVANWSSSYTYRIVTEWRDPSSKKLVRFRSEALWEDPTSRARGRVITVLVDRNDVKRYAMDLSFLREKSRTPAQEL